MDYYPKYMRIIILKFIITYQNTQYQKKIQINSTTNMSNASMNQLQHNHKIYIRRREDQCSLFYFFHLSCFYVYYKFIF